MNLPTTKPNDIDYARLMREWEFLDDRNKVLERENAALRALLLRIRTEKDLLKTRPGAQDQYAGMPPMYRLIDTALAKNLDIL